MKSELKKYITIRSPIKYFVFVIVYFTIMPFCKVIFFRKNRWLICERGDDAQDNGFVFFKYLCEKQHEVEPIYLIKKESPDYKKVSAIGKTVQFGSLKHFLLVVACPVKISSNLFGYSPWEQLTTYLRRNKTKDIHVFLQHGITKNLHYGMFQEVCNSLKLFVCGSKLEYEYILNNYNYTDSVPQYTGLARFDLLVSQASNNQILIMPTWRKNLVSMSNDEFLQSNYFYNWNSLIHSNALLEECRKKKIVIKFYLHFMLQKFSRLFVGNDVLKIVLFKDEPVQKLLIESKMLITDFSSVYFDFGYMHKPVVHFQFDEDSFYKEHYEKGYFDYRKDGFGDICVTMSSALSSIRNCIKSNFSIEDKYLKRIDLTFVYHDFDNCERIFKAIKGISK